MYMKNRGHILEIAMTREGTMKRVRNEICSGFAKSFFKTLYQRIVDDELDRSEDQNRFKQKERICRVQINKIIKKVKDQNIKL